MIHQRRHIVAERFPPLSHYFSGSVSPALREGRHTGALPVSSVSVREAGNEKEVCQTNDHNEGTRFATDGERGGGLAFCREAVCASLSVCRRRADHRAPHSNSTPGTNLRDKRQGLLYRQA